MKPSSLKVLVASAITLLASVVGLGLAEAAAAEGPQRPAMQGAMHGGRHHMPLLRILKQLDLTPEQEQSVRSILESSAQRRDAFREKQRATLEALLKTMPDDPNYPALIAEQKQLAADAIQFGSEIHSQIYDLLTPEQKAKVPELLAEMKARMEERREWHRKRHAEPEV